MSELGCLFGYKCLDFNKFPFEFCAFRQRLNFLATQNGHAIKLRLNNTNSSSAVNISSISISTSGSKEVSITLNGKSAIHVPAYQELETDFAFLCVTNKDKISIITCFEAGTCESACCFFNNEFCDVSYEDQNKQEYMPKSEFYEKQPNLKPVILIDRVLISMHEKTNIIVAFGDSITHMSRWTAPLALRLLNEQNTSFSLINLGICGNRVLHGPSNKVTNGDWFGASGASRFETDIFKDGLPPPRSIILLQGINDLLHPASGSAPASEEVTANEIFEGLLEMTRTAHSYKTKVICCTILPFKGSDSSWCNDLDLKRQHINELIINSDFFDSIIDFDEITKSKTDPQSLDPTGESDDFLHPGINGGLKMANAIDLAVLF